MLRSAFFAFFAGIATQAGAHPHVFVDTALRIVVTEGRAVAVDLTWSYDDLTSLLILEDMGLDPDGDGALTEAELARLRGFDLEVWPEGFEGDLYVWGAGEKVALGAPEATGIAVENGRIVASHRRSLPDVPVAGLELRQFDPTYYVAYTLAAPVAVTGTCSAAVEPHDPGAADRVLQEALTETPEDQFEVLELGIHYADTIRIACAASS